MIRVTVLSVTKCVWLFGCVPSSFTSMKNKAPELSLPLFVRLWVPVKQTNPNHLLLAVDPVRLALQHGSLGHIQHIHYEWIPTHYIPGVIGSLKKNQRRQGADYLWGDQGMCLSEMTSCSSCDAHKSTSEVSAWQNELVELVWVPEMKVPGSLSFSCLCSFPCFHTSHFPFTHNGVLPVGSPFHTTASHCCIFCNMPILVVKRNDFRQNWQVCDVAVATISHYLTVLLSGCPTGLCGTL